MLLKTFFDRLLGQQILLHPPPNLWGVVGKEGTAPAAETRGPAKGHKATVKQKAFKYKLNRRGGGRLPAATVRERGPDRDETARPGPAAPSGPGLGATTDPGPSPPLTARLRGRQPRARRPRPSPSPAAPGLTQKIRLRKTRTVLEEVMPHCPIAPAAAPQPPAAPLSSASLRSAPLSSAPPPAPPHVTQASPGGGAGSLRWRPFASRGGRGRRNLRWRTATP